MNAGHSGRFQQLPSKGSAREAEAETQEGLLPLTERSVWRGVSKYLQDDDEPGSWAYDRAAPADDLEVTALYLQKSL